MDAGSSVAQLKELILVIDELEELRSKPGTLTDADARRAVYLLGRMDEMDAELNQKLGLKREQRSIPPGLMELLRVLDGMAEGKEQMEAAPITVTEMPDESGIIIEGGSSGDHATALFKVLQDQVKKDIDRYRATLASMPDAAHFWERLARYQYSANEEIAEFLNKSMITGTPVGYQERVNITYREMLAHEVALLGGEYERNGRLLDKNERPDDDAVPPAPPTPDDENKNPHPTGWNTDESPVAAPQE